MKALLLFLIAFAGLASTLKAQLPPSLVPEYGSLTEITETGRVFVFSEDYEAREAIIKTLTKKGNLQVVGKPEEADFIITYGLRGVETGFASFFNIIMRTGYDIGDFIVAKAGDKQSDGTIRPRILWAKKKKGGSSPFIKKNWSEQQVTLEFLKQLHKAHQKPK